MLGQASNVNFGSMLSPKIGTCFAGSAALGAFCLLNYSHGLLTVSPETTSHARVLWLKLGFRILDNKPTSGGD